MVFLNFDGMSNVGEKINELCLNKIVFFIISIIVAFGLIKTGINLINPPFGWDSLNYHFTFPIEWLKHGNLDNPITISDDPSPSYYPINGSLFFLWLMLPFRNVFMADLGQLPFFILAFLAVFNIARKLAISREFSFYASALFTLIPNYFKQLQIAYVDVMVAALFLACYNFLFTFEKKFSWQNAVAYSISLGLLLGTKTVALPYGLLLLIPFLYQLLKNRVKFRVFSISLFLILILGGFTYFRNFLNTGNCLYPLDFKLLGRTIFKGVMDNKVYSIHFELKDYSLSKLLFHEGLGGQSIVFILPAVFLGLPIALIKRRKEIDFNRFYLLILPLLIYLVYRYVIPLANTRYLYPLFGVGIVIAFYILNILNIPRFIVNILVVMCALSSMFELAKGQELIFSIILTFLLFFLGKAILNFIRNNKLISHPLFIGFYLLFIVFGLVFLNRFYNLNEYSRYERMVKYSGFWSDAVRGWEWLNKNTAGKNIAYVGRPVPFPLYGTNFKNNVFYVSINKVEPVKLHYFLNGHYRWDSDFMSLHKNLEAEGNYRSNADYSVWLGNLARRNINYLFVYSLHQTKEIAFPLEDAWAKINPGKFVPVFSNETIHIYKLVDGK
jgi:hypothetical protein